MRTLIALPVLAAAAVAAVPAQAQEAGDWLVRARAILVEPNDDSGTVTGIAGSAATVDGAVMPELDFTYMFTDHVGAELILATTKHDINGAGTIGALGKVADVWALPPTLTVQYHFTKEGRVHPYLGAGVNYTTFYSAKSTSSLNTALGNTKVKLGDSFGFALQAGVDVDLTDRVFLNADIKYIDMDSRATLTSGATVRTLDTELNPIVAGLGLGVRF